MLRSFTMATEHNGNLTSTISDGLITLNTNHITIVLTLQECAEMQQMCSRLMVASQLDLRSKADRQAPPPTPPIGALGASTSMQASQYDYDSSRRTREFD